MIGTLARSKLPTQRGSELDPDLSKRSRVFRVENYISIKSGNPRPIFAQTRLVAHKQGAILVSINVYSQINVKILDNSILFEVSSNQATYYPSHICIYLAAD